MRPLKLGTRGSALARWQSDHVVARLAAAVPGLAIHVVEILSTGDRVLDVPLSEVEGTGFFTATIERALSHGEIDVAVHSYKDLPVEASPDLVVAAVCERGPVEDVLCARNDLSLARLPAGARIGTCSLRRQAQLRALRRDIALVPLRGNVPTRLERVHPGDLDGIVLARAGLVRLGLERHITEVFAPDVVVPAPAQGALAVQCRRDDHETRSLLRGLDHDATRRAVDAERAVLHALGGGCSLPVGAFARGHGGALCLDGVVLDLDGIRQARVHVRGEYPDEVGAAAARQLIELGARDILAACAAPAPSVPPPDAGERS